MAIELRVSPDTLSSLLQGHSSFSSPLIEWAQYRDSQWCSGGGGRHLGLNWLLSPSSESRWPVVPLFLFLLSRTFSIWFILLLLLMSDPQNNCNICFGGSDCSHFLGALGDNGNKVDSLCVFLFPLVLSW